MNPYEILGVDKSASTDEIKKAYRKLSKEHHPDKGGNEEKFKDIAAAYDILSDPQKKQNYDAFGDAKGNPNPFGGGGFSGFDDFVNSFFSGGRRQPQTKRGSNTGVHVQMSLLDILKGASKKITYTRNDKCDSCAGSGGTDSKNCGTCNGSGQYTQATNTPFGYMQQVMVCPTCAGSGKIIKNACNKCKGSGVNSKTETISVSIPPGTHNGQQLNMSGGGNYVREGVPGDLIVIIDEIPDELFKREIIDGMMTNNLKYDLWISVSDAVLGSKKIIKAPLGDLSFNIEPGCPSGKIYRFDKKGFPNTNGYENGDLLVTINIIIPTKVTEETRNLYEQLRKYDKQN